MIRPTRREFLKNTIIAGGSLASVPLWSQAQEAPAEPLDMCIARWQGAAASAPEEIKTLATKLTEQAISALGGMKRFVSKGDVVWIKPNLAWDRTPEQAANTNPDVVAALIRMCFDAGAKTVKVGDNPCNDAQKAYPASGIEAAAKASGAEVVYLDPNRLKETAINGKVLTAWPLSSEILDTDLVINVPVVKHHRIATVTLCMKNYMGVAGRETKRNQWHQDLSTCLCDITAFMKPRLCVLDAVRVMTANGPSGGNLADVKRMDTVAAGVDIVALDALGAELLGHKPESIGTIAAGFSAGLGQIDYRKLRHKELAVT